MDTNNTEVKQLLHQETVHADFTALKKDGTSVPVAVHIFPLHRASGRKQYYAAHLQSTLLVPMEDGGSQKAEQEKSENKEQTTYIATISHELRTPLNGIIGTVSLMLGSKIDTAELQENLEIIFSCSQMLLMLINNVIVK